MAVYDVEVALPKFESAPADALALEDTLEALGMPLAFNPSKADFTGIATPSLYIDNVYQKTFVKLDEKGTEAVAATAVVGAKKRGGKRTPPPKAEFHADHPFLFFLRDIRSGMILFLGRVSDPLAK